MKRKYRSIVFNLLKIIISAGALAYVLFWQIDLKQLVLVAQQARWGYLAVAGVLAVLGVAWRALRWKVLLDGLGSRVPAWQLVKLYFVGTFFNMFLLSGLGGDAIRVIELSRGHTSPPEAAGTVLVDRATGLWTMFVMGLIALPFAAGTIPTPMVWLVGGVALLAVTGGWVVMATRLISWLGQWIRLPGQAHWERFYHAVNGCGYVALGQACAISLVFNLSTIWASYLIARGLNVELPFGTFFLFVPLLSMSLLIPSVGGLGVSEEIYRRMYGTLDVDGSASVAMSLARYALQTALPGLIGGVWYIIDGLLGLRSRSEVG